jgi:hypothetical protein
LPKLPKSPELPKFETNIFERAARWPDACLAIMAIMAILAFMAIFLIPK